MSLKIKFALLLLLLIIVPLSSGMVEGLKDIDSPNNSISKAGIEMKTRKLLMLDLQDYDDAGANNKHDPRKKPGTGKP